MMKIKNNMKLARINSGWWSFRDFIPNFIKPHKEITGELAQQHALALSVVSALLFILGVITTFSGFTTESDKAINMVFTSIMLISFIISRSRHASKGAIFLVFSVLVSLP